ncbi:enoyl reductase [Saccharata proteae CBS 121410]|uniref:Enoyl reductase n=1 Tax=Saccharata proteae CBS 121410 TaxID=1314787 RepID=A0A9P4HZW6_9PEZI|nr:enoyl reductase [Saccharata proteae CBS 121410]
MATENVTLVVQPRGKPIRKLPSETTIALTDSTAELYKRLAAATGSSVHRLRVAKGSDGSVVPNNTKILVESTGLRQKSTITVKDLGPQIAWRTVFLVEYLGPILIHPLIFYGREYIYPTPSLKATPLPEPTAAQYAILYMCILHFIKREFETIFVHRFSSATMPAFNIFKNSGHYWALSGLLIAYFAYGPVDASSPLLGPVAMTAATFLFPVAELANLSTHLTLRNLRPANDPTARGIPKGLGFDLVTCPNYLFETLAWACVALASACVSLRAFLATSLFIVVAAGQMAAWAAKKEKRYRKEFGSTYQRKKFAMLPGIF